MTAAPQPTLFDLRESSTGRLHEQAGPQTRRGAPAPQSSASGAPVMSVADPPPANTDAEKAILGAILLDNEAYNEATDKLGLKGSDFFLDSHRRIWRRMAALMKEQRAVDIVTLSEGLNRHKEIETIGGVAYLASLTEGLPRRPVIEDYIRIVKERRQERAALKLAESVTARVSNGVETGAQITAWAAQQFAALADEESGIRDAGRIEAVGLKLKRGTEIADREQRWLVQDFLPDDSLIVVAGQIGLGKTTACMDLAASVTNGRVPIIGGKREASNVLMLSNEDSEAQLRRIFTRLGGNLSGLYVEDEDSDLPWGLGDLRALEARIVELRPALVIIDSLTTHKPSKVDMNSHGDVAPMLVGLRKLASLYGCAIVVIHHTNKALTSDPLAKISGSIGISAIARHVILVAQHPEDENLRVAAIAKTNLCKPGAQSYQFRLDPFGWHGGTELRAADLLQGSTGESEPDAEDFLREALADGKVDSAVLFRQGEGGYGLNRRSIQRAADRLNVERTFAGFGAGRKVYWSLPSTMDDTIDDKTVERVIHGRQPMESALFDAGSTIDDKKQESVIHMSSMDGQPDENLEGAL